MFIFVLLIATSAHAQRTLSKAAKGTSTKIAPIQADTIRIKPVFQLPDTMQLVAKDSAGIKIHLEGDQFADNKEKPVSNDIILALVSLFTGALLTLLIDHYRGRRRTWESGQRWIAEAKVYKIITEAQPPIMQNIMDTEKPDAWGVYELQVATNLEGEIFNSMNNEELLKHLNKDGKLLMDEAVRLTNRFTGTISALRHLYSQLLNAYEGYKENISKRSREVNEKLQQIGALLAAWEVAIQQRNFNGVIEQQAFNAALRLHRALHGGNLGDPNDLYNLESQYLNPLITAIVSMRTDQIILDVLNTISQCKHAIAGIRVEKEYLLEIAEKFRDRYNNNVSHLNESITITAALPIIKKWWQVWKWA